MSADIETLAFDAPIGCEAHPQANLGKVLFSKSGRSALVFCAACADEAGDGDAALAAGRTHLVSRIARCESIELEGALTRH